MATQAAVKKLKATVDAYQLYALQEPTKEAPFVQVIYFV
jgi:hypothetical protein